MVQFAIWIAAAIFILVLIGASLGLIISAIKIVIAAPYAFYIGLNEPRLKKQGFDTEFKSNKLSFKEIFRFYGRALTFRRPLLP